MCKGTSPPPKLNRMWIIYLRGWKQGSGPCKEVGPPKATASRVRYFWTTPTTSNLQTQRASIRRGHAQPWLLRSKSLERQLLSRPSKFIWLFNQPAPRSNSASRQAHNSSKRGRHSEATIPCCRYAAQMNPQSRTEAEKLFCRQSTSTSLYPPRFDTWLSFN